MKKSDLQRSVVDLWTRSAIPLTPGNLAQHAGASAAVVERLLVELAREGVVQTAEPGAWKVVGKSRPSAGPRTFDELERLNRLNREVESAMSAKRERQAQAAQAEAEARAERQALVLASRKELAAELDDPPDDGDDELEDLNEERPGLLGRVFGRKDFDAGDALEVASAAKQELEGPREPNQKSLLWAGGLGLIGGPLGWLYAGAWRESVPAAVLYAGAALVLSYLPSMLLFPVLAVLLPVSSLIGIGYAWQHNKHGARQRLLTGTAEDDEKARKAKKKR